MEATLYITARVRVSACAWASRRRADQYEPPRGRWAGGEEGEAGRRSPLPYPPPTNNTDINDAIFFWGGGIKAKSHLSPFINVDPLRRVRQFQHLSKSLFRIFLRACYLVVNFPVQNL